MRGGPDLRDHAVTLTRRLGVSSSSLQGNVRVHDEVSEDEMNLCVIQTYLAAGEALALTEKSPLEAG
jgi:hypothetical protein